MPTDEPVDTRTWLAEQVAAYRAVFPQFQRFAELLGSVLKRAARELAPLSIIQTRPKSITSFAEKALRKQHKYRDPVGQLTDLCGARVIARTRSEVAALCRFLEEHFDVDWPNSLDASRRLKPTEFGYRSIHYILSFRQDREDVYGFDVPRELLGKKAEVQVRTVVEHAYADFAHDLTYKGAFPLPVAWQRELAGVAAALEEADQTFARIEERLSAYATNYGSYLSPEELDREIEFLSIVLELDPGNAPLAVRLAKLAHRREDWQRAQEVLEPFVDPQRAEDAAQPVLRELGVTYCKRFPRGSDEYGRGQTYLELASAPEHADVDAICSLAGTWKGVDDSKVRELYRRAFETDPTNTYALGSYLEYELPHNPGALAAARPLMEAAVARAEAQAEARVNLPWAYFDIGKFRLLLDQPYRSLDAFCKALLTTTAPFMIETSLDSLEVLSGVPLELTGLEWIRRLLTVGLAARFPSPERIEKVRAMATQGVPPLAPPVLIAAGGTDPRVEERMKGYSPLFLEAMAGFRGTVISGGTTQGISGLVGDAAEAFPDSIRAVGYLPALIPKDATKDTDPLRYQELRYTDGKGFSPLEPLQNWVDILAAGIPIQEVRLLGIGGGAIAAAEYRIGLALGACVGIVEGGGREGDRILTDPMWAEFGALVRLPPDGPTLRAFLDWTPAEELPEEVCESLARAIHEAYREERLRSGSLSDLALSDWESLRDDFKDSNRNQARHIPRKLRAIGCSVVPKDAYPETSSELDPGEIEALARLEHGRWVVEKLLAGWQWGPERDPDKKTNPSLVAWEDLPEAEKNKDRQTVRRIPEYLEGVGYGILRGG